MNGLKAVEELAVYLSKHLDCKVFKFAKTANYEGEPYICINYLAIQYGKWVNSCIVNVNVHQPNMSNGQPDTISLSNLSDKISRLIPKTNNQTEDDAQELILGGIRYEFDSDSNCMEDADNTYFINFRIKATF